MQASDPAMSHASHANATAPAKHIDMLSVLKMPVLGRFSQGPAAGTL
jgi:hypothetical protein